jgi:protein-tyrosine phosphatase
MGGLVAQPPPGTRAVLNVCGVTDSYRTAVYQWSPINDGPPPPSLGWLSQMVQFVATQRRAGATTYVHCQAGVSRSGLVTVAYVMSEHRWGVEQALFFVKSRRPQTNPKPAFMPLLNQWQQSVLGGAP